MHRWIGTIAATLCSLLMGCSGRVSMDDGSFGVLNSTALVELQSQEETEHFVVMSSAMGICRKLRRAYQDYSLAYVDWASTLESGDLDEACVQRQAMFELGADLSKGFMSGGDRLLYFSFWQEDESYVVPEVGTWQLEGEDQGFYGYVNQFESNPYVEMVNTWASADCDSDSATVDEAVTRLWLDAGFMDVSRSTPRGLSGRIEAELLDEDNDFAGEFTAKIKADSCKIEVDAEQSYFILF